jgi:hypothetical protein
MKRLGVVLFLAVLIALRAPVRGGSCERDRNSGRIGIQAASSAFGAALVSAVAMSRQPSSFRNTICPVATSQDRVLTR